MSSSPSYIERRAYPRERVQIEADLWSQEHKLAVSIIELAEGGMAIANGTIPEKTDVHLRFELPLTTSIIRCEARIVWASTAQDRAGLQFTRLADTDKRILAHWLKHHCASATPAQAD